VLKKGREPGTVKTLEEKRKEMSKARRRKIQARTTELVEEQLSLKEARHVRKLKSKLRRPK